MNAAPLLALGLLLMAGCTEPTQAPPAPVAPECPEPVTESNKVLLQRGHHNLDINETSLPAGHPLAAAHPYEDFTWEAPERTPVTLEMRAEWDSDTLGEETLKIQLRDSQESFFRPFSVARGTSPIILNLATNVTENALRIDILPDPDPVAGATLGVNKVEMEILVTVTQTIPCLP